MKVLNAVWPAVLLGVYPVLLLLSGMSTTLQSVVDSTALAALVSTVFAFLGWLLAGRLTPDVSQRTLLVALFSVSMFFPGVATTTRIGDVFFPAAFLALWMSISGLAALFILRTRRPSAAATFVRAFAALLSASALIALPRKVVFARSIHPARRDVRIAAADSLLPSIYLIIPDKYTSSRSLRENFQFDNSEVERDLRSRGFVLPSASRPNYVRTFLSLPSLLNWSHLDSLATHYGERSSDREPAHRMFRENRLVSMAHARGYEVVFIPSPYPPFREMTSSDELVDLSLADLSAAELWWKHSFIAMVRDTWCHGFGCGFNHAAPFEGDSPAVVRAKLDTIVAISERKAPQLLIAHLLLPHEPYTFRADCTPRAPFWPMADTGRGAATWRAAYVEQVQCTNRLIVSLVSRILERSPRPPVILIQSDHGHGGITVNAILGRDTPLSQLSPEAIRDRTSIFTAYYLPGMDPRSVSDSITSINLFPLVLNHYWGERIPTQPNRVSWSDFATPYRFIPLSRTP